ncbi:CPBP family glutamic-type intramembrane protease [Afifella marina]|uniref:CPBP family glutamic-type intramembrane protease n=1 Tax=Afifella marina TaxID=1080 RepID=UPI000A81629E|nr:CPBP family glutamic-type intramembrane protease [Afifella marina]MBK1623701.1 CPBP family intramembrane metalloprotease [Afifella marina DSM 2698]MBK1626694.1 CPBP family intramembrane metalloprotease [Afifella marina]MBK5916243.1 hypothetical protein [Afifella marina]RAI21567.1 hypothetical protein CH311_05975 [Afifella marina DSM 2698]
MRFRLLGEAALLYLAAPLAIHWMVINWHMPVFALLTMTLPAILLIFAGDRSFRWKETFRLHWPIGVLRRILILFVGAAAFLTAATAWFLPDGLFGLPRIHPQRWLLILILYPLLSALPQELIYRVWFFHRYRSLFGHHAAVAVAANAALFAVAHIIFGSAVSVTGAFLLGLLLARRYEQARSFWPVWLEHVLYGDLVFTIGLGRFFYLSAGG